MTHNTHEIKVSLNPTYSKPCFRKWALFLQIESHYHIQNSANVFPQKNHFSRPNSKMFKQGRGVLTCDNHIKFWNKVLSALYFKFQTISLAGGFSHSHGQNAEYPAFSNSQKHLFRQSPRFPSSCSSAHSLFQLGCVRKTSPAKWLLQCLTQPLEASLCTLQYGLLLFIESITDCSLSPGFAPGGSGLDAGQPVLARVCSPSPGAAASVPVLQRQTRDVALQKLNYDSCCGRLTSPPWITRSKCMHVAKRKAQRERALFNSALEFNAVPVLTEWRTVWAVSCKQLKLTGQFWHVYHVMEYIGPFCVRERSSAQEQSGLTLSSKKSQLGNVLTRFS